MSEMPATLPAAATKIAIDAAGAGVRDLAREAKRDASIAWKVVGVIACFGIACSLIYLLVRDSRDGHAMTQDEYVSSNKERDEKVAAVRVEFQAITIRLATAIESVATLKTDVKDAESRLRTEIQGTNARIDRVLEAVSKPPR